MRRHTYAFAAALAALCLLAGCAGSSGLQEVVQRDNLPSRIELEHTPFFAQSEYQCGPAALATLLGAAGVAVTPESLVHEIYLPERHGSLQPELIAAVRARGLVPYVLQPELPVLLTELAAGRPVLVLQRQGFGPWPAWHYAVAVGYDAPRERVLLRSGRQPELALPTRQFVATWDRAGRWALLALPPGQMPAQPELAAYLAAVAGLEARGGTLQAARAGYLAAVHQWPDEAMPRLGLANMDAAATNWGAAARGYRAALARDPENVAAQNNLAESLRHLGCLHAATAAVSLAAKWAPSGHALHESVRDTAAQITADAAGLPAAVADPVSCDGYLQAAAGEVP